MASSDGKGNDNENIDDKKNGNGNEDAGDDNKEENQTTLCLLRCWMLSLLRGPGIRRNVRVAATWNHQHNRDGDADDDEDENDVGNHGDLVLLRGSKEEVGDDEQVLVKLVNCVGDCPVQVIFL